MARGHTAYGLVSLLLSASCGCGSQTVAFLDAVQYGDVKKVQAMLQEDPSLVHVENHLSETALNVAVELDKKAIVRILVEAGSDVNHDTSRLGTPLSYVAYFGDAGMIEILLDAGAEVDLPSKWHHDAPLLNACLRGKYENVKLLLDRGADVNLRNEYGNTPLHKALYAVDEDNQIRIIKLLIERGADVNAKNYDGLPPRMDAELRMQEAEELHRKLQEKGRQPTCNSEGLHYCARLANCWRRPSSTATPQKELVPFPKAECAWEAN